MSQVDSGRLKRLRDKVAAILIEPLPVADVKHNLHRYRLRLLAALLLLLIPASVVIAIMPWFTDPNYDFTQDIGFWPTIFTLVGFLIVYALTRLGYYRFPMRLLIMIVTTAAYLLAIIDTSGIYIGILSFLFVPVLMASFLLNAAWTTGLAIGNLIGLLLLPNFFDHITTEAMLNGPFSIGLIISALIVPMTYYREKWQREHEESIQESRRRFKQMVEFYPTMVSVEYEGRYVYVNRAGLNLLGVQTIDDIVGKPVQDFTHPDYHDEISAKVVRQTTGEGMLFQSHERIVRQDGQAIDVEVNAMHTTYRGQIATQKFIKPLAEPDRQTSGRYRQVVETITEMIIVIDRHGKILDMNASAIDRLGYLVGNPIETIISTSGKLSINGIQQPHIDFRTESGKLQTDLLDKSGNTLPVAIRYVEDPATSGGGVIVATDQTERKINHEVLQQSEERFARIFSSNVIGISISTLDEGRFIDANDYFLKLLGYERDEIIGRTTTDLKMYPEDASPTPFTRQQLVKRLKEKKALQNNLYRIRTKSGDIRDVRASLELITLGGEECILNLTQDVTHQIKMERDLHESEGRYRTITELMTDYAYYLKVNEDGNIKLDWVTGAFHRITGYSQEEADEWGSWNSLVHEEDTPLVRQHLRRLLKGKAGEIEYRLRTRSGDVRWIHQADQPVVTENGTQHVTGIYGVAHDITTRMKAENALRDHALQQAVVAELGQRALEHDVEGGVLHEEAVRLTAHVLSADVCMVWLLDEHSQTLQIHSSAITSPDAPPLRNRRIPVDDLSHQTTYTLHQNEPVLVTDYLQEQRFEVCETVHTIGTRSSASIGIYGQDARPLGALVVHSTTPAFFTIDDANYMQSIANVLAAYIEQQHAKHAEREQRILAETLRDIAASLNSTLDFDRLMDQMLDKLALIVPYDTASLMLLTEGKNAAIIRHRGFENFGVDNELLDELLLPKENVFVTKMIDRGGAYVVSDVTNEPDWLPIPSTEFIRSHVGAPIFSQGRLAGIINVDSTTPNAFTEEHAERLMAFAHQAAIALANARHAEELERSVRERTAELNLEHQRLQTILDASGEGIFYTEGMRIRYANRLLGELTGIDVETLTGKSPAELIATDLPEAQRIDWASIQIRLKDEGVIRQETCIVRSDGSQFDAGLTMSLYGQQNGVVKMVVIVRDISQAKKLEKQKSRFIADASHELRTPLASLNMRLYMLRREPAKLEANVANLERGIERMSNLVEDLLDLSRFENGVIQLHPVDVILQTLIIEVIEMQQARAIEKQISLTETLIDHPVHAFADPDRIRQVLNNLVGNAINYTPDGGTVHLSMETDHYWAIVHVTDNGVGIDKDSLEHIFQPFYRSNKNAPGTGLGLSISNEIMQQHRGKITVMSEPGQGSTFSMYLPLSNTPRLDD